MEATQPMDPTFPKVGLNILLSIFAGFFLAIGLTLMVEMIDRRIRSEEDVNQQLGVPLYGTVLKAS
jgi:capsular polysaccharide biosynthesis protein